VKLPRDVNADHLIQLLGKYGYVTTRQSGSHIRLTSNYKTSVHHITVPNHNPIKIGTLSGIISDIAIYLEIDRWELIDNLFKRD
jgi:predicted RNA binding protein YcfA (HicA-like mRNA interferase family)